MSAHDKKSNVGTTVVFIVLALAALAMVVKALITGKNVALFNPKGLIAHEQLGLILFMIGVLLAVIIPVLAILYFTAWKYRESNTKAAYEPEKKHGRSLDAFMWLFPGAIMVVLAVFMFAATHRLEPQSPIASDAEPLTIQVVAQRWKWLFIYPEENIATVNYVQIPVDRPVTFELTADDVPMSGFWIPNLGGMLYAMTGHVNPLNLLAHEPGDYPGSSAEVNGHGFAGMKFTARVSSAEDFDQWVEGVKQVPEVLDSAAYERLLRPVENHPGAFYSSADKSLYDKVLRKYNGSAEGHASSGNHAADHHGGGH